MSDTTTQPAWALAAAIRIDKIVVDIIDKKRSGLTYNDIAAVIVQCEKLRDDELRSRLSSLEEENGKLREAQQKQLEILGEVLAVFESDIDATDELFAYQRAAEKIYGFADKVRAALSNQPDTDPAKTERERE